MYCCCCLCNLSTPGQPVLAGQILPVHRHTRAGFNPSPRCTKQTIKRQEGLTTNHINIQLDPFAAKLTIYMYSPSWQTHNTPWLLYRIVCRYLKFSYSRQSYIKAGKVIKRYWELRGWLHVSKCISFLQIYHVTNIYWFSIVMIVTFLAIKYSVQQR